MDSSLLSWYERNINVDDVWLLVDLLAYIWEGGFTAGRSRAICSFVAHPDVGTTVWRQQESDQIMSLTFPNYLLHRPWNQRVNWRSGSVVRASDYWLGTPGNTNIVLSCRTLDKFVRSTLLQFTQLYDWILGYRELLVFVYYWSLHINYSVAECFQGMSRWCSIENVCQGAECNAPWSVLTTGYYNTYNICILNRLHQKKIKIRHVVIYFVYISKYFTVHTWTQDC